MPDRGTTEMGSVLTGRSEMDCCRSSLGWFPDCPLLVTVPSKKTLLASATDGHVNEAAGFCSAVWALVRSLRPSGWPKTAELPLMIRLSNYAHNMLKPSGWPCMSWQPTASSMVHFQIQLVD